MNRREFLIKLGISATVLSTIAIDNLEKEIPEETELKLDQKDTGEFTGNFLEVEISGELRQIPIYTSV